MLEVYRAKGSRIQRVRASIVNFSLKGPPCTGRKLQAAGFTRAKPRCNRGYAGTLIDKRRYDVMHAAGCARAHSVLLEHVFFKLFDEKCKALSKFFCAKESS